MLSLPESQIDRGGKCTKLPPSGPRFSLHFTPCARDAAGHFVSSLAAAKFFLHMTKKLVS